MARGSAARKTLESQPSRDEAVHRFGGGPPSPPTLPNTTPVSNARLGLSMFLASEAMFFAGLIGAFLVFRLGAANWPPPFQPRLPVLVTGINTFILLSSALTMRWALGAIRSGRPDGLVKYLSLTVLLGVVFLAVQGYEWLRLIGFGLTVSSGTYGATFYTLIGFHGLHVLGAVIWLTAVLIRSRRGRFTAAGHTAVELCGIYWNFVVALWPILYGLVYF